MLVGELDQVEIGVRNQNVFRLAADPSAHVHIAVSGARTRRIHGQADSGLAFAAIAAAPARDVERHGNEVADVQELDVAALLDHLARDLVSQHQSRRRGGSAAHHVLIAATDIGGDDLQDDAVIDLLAGRVLQFREVDGLDFDFARREIHYASITCHKNLLSTAWSKCVGQT